VTLLFSPSRFDELPRFFFLFFFFLIASAIEIFLFSFSPGAERQNPSGLLSLPRGLLKPQASPRSFFPSSPFPPQIACELVEEFSSESFPLFFLGDDLEDRGETSPPFPRLSML